MTITQADIDTYMITDADIGDSPPSYYPKTPIYSDAKVTPLIDGESYFGALFREIEYLGTGSEDEVSKQGVYIMGWWLKPDFRKSPSDDAGPTLIELLRNKAKAGVDVRILVWVNDWLLDTSDTLFDLLPEDLQKKAQQRPQIENLEFVESERNNSDSRIEVLINHLDHPKGSAHAKAFLVFSKFKSTLFTGGIDLREDRFATPIHGAGGASYDDMFTNKWHDIQLMVEGESTYEFYVAFANMWNEILSKSSESTPRYIFESYDRETKQTTLKGPIFARTLSNTLLTKRNDFDQLISTGGSHVQSLFTFPAEDIFWSRESDHFISDGVYQIRLALLKAINAAQVYIYIEDQMFWSRELFSLLSDALVDSARPNLKLVLMTGAADPNDVPNGSSVSQVNAINDFLFSRLTEDQTQRVILFSSDSTIHSKTWLIDDKWGFVGSANMANRSLYIDIEHAISFMDEELVRKLRVDLWGEHLGFPPSETNTVRDELLQDIHTALNILSPEWGTQVETLMIPSYANRLDDIFRGGQYVWDGIEIPFFSYPFGKYDFAVDSGAVDKILTNDFMLLSPYRIEQINRGINITENEIILLTLKNSISGLFILCTSGPNNGVIREIERSLLDEQGTHIYFRPMPFVNDSSTQFMLIKSRTKRIYIPEYTGNQIPSLWKLENIDDPGEAP